MDELKLNRALRQQMPYSFLLKGRWVFNLTISVLVFSCIFYPFLTKGEVPGFVDFKLNIALLNYYYEHTLAFLFDSFRFGIINYPDGEFYWYGEPMFLTSIFYLPWKALGLSDFWCYNILLITVFSLNAVSVSYLLNFFGARNWIGLFTGIAFGLLNFVFSQIDNINSLTLFPFIFSISHYARLQTTFTFRDTWFISLLFGIQLYTNVYAALFMVLSSVLFSLTNPNAPWASRIYITAATLISKSVWTIPYVYFFLMKDSAVPFVSNQFNNHYLDYLGLRMSDFLNTLPYNLVFGSNSTGNFGFIEAWHCAFVGFTFPALALVGSFFSFSGRPSVLLAAVVSFALSLGPFIGSIDSPLYAIHEHLPILYNFKHISRFYLMCLVFMTIPFGQALERLSNFFGDHLSWVVPLSFIAIMIVENFPFSSQNYLGNSLPKYSTRLEHALDGVPHSKSILVVPFLNVHYSVDYHSLFNLGKIEAYGTMYLQTTVGYNLVNSNNGVSPRAQLMLHDQLTDLDSCICGQNNPIVSRWHIDAVLVNKKSSLPIGSFMEQNKECLKKVYAGETFDLYKLKPVSYQAMDCQLTNFTPYME